MANQNQTKPGNRIGGPGSLAGKRAIGFVNWHRRRKTIHRGEVLSRIVSDLKAHNPDLLFFAGGGTTPMVSRTLA